MLKIVLMNVLCGFQLETLLKPEFYRVGYTIITNIRRAFRPFLTDFGPLRPWPHDLNTQKLVLLGQRVYIYWDTLSEWIRSVTRPESHVSNVFSVLKYSPIYSSRIGVAAVEKSPSYGAQPTGSWIPLQILKFSTGQIMAQISSRIGRLTSEGSPKSLKRCPSR